jgi:two-component system sensor histidine kinase RegB
VLAVQTDDTLSRDALPRDNVSHPRRVPPTLSASLPIKDAAPSVPACERLRAQLRTLGVLRALTGVGLVLAIVVLEAWLRIAMPLGPLAAGLAVLIGANVWLMRRLAQARPITEREFFVQIVIDLGWLANTIYWTGGATHNPFADLFVIYVGMAAIVLQVRHVVAVCALGLVVYSALQFFHHDLVLLDASIDAPTLESLAHATHYVVFSAIVAVFGYRLAHTTRRYFQLEGRARERDVRAESAVNLAALAAGTAHEMGTPLTTIATLVGELRQPGLSADEREASLKAISAAVAACKTSLSEMVVTMGADHINEAARVSARSLLEQLVQKFKPMRPNVPLTVTVECAESCQVETSAPLRQALLNLISNAADASSVGIELRLRCDPNEIQIDVLDRGPGIPKDVMAKLGTEFVTTKSELRGSGVGVYLANLTLTRLGGRLQYLSREGGGTCARVTLPLAEYRPQP